MELTTADDKDQAALIESSIARLLSRLETKKEKLEPVIETDGKVHYPLAESALRSDGVRDPALVVRTWIADLAAAGIIRASSTFDIAVCPVHHRADPMVQLECGNCKQRSVRRTSLVQHTYCGFIGEDSRFKKDGALQCPSCKQKIEKTKELRVTGVWYECPSCHSKASSPKVLFVCKEGNHDYTVADLVQMRVNTYEVVGGVISELGSKLVVIPPLAEMLKNLGYDVSSPASVKGQSGVAHELDLYCRKDGEDVALSVVVDSNPVEAAPVMTLFSKVLDIKPKLTVLVVIPAASDVARQISEEYGFCLVEDKDGDGVVQKVRALLDKRTNLQGPKGRT